MKAMIIVNMPESCKRCDFCYEWIAEFECTRCGKRFPKSRVELKQDWCPLRPVPDKYVIPPSVTSRKAEFGWIRCIEEILGEK